MEDQANAPVGGLNEKVEPGEQPADVPSNGSPGPLNPTDMSSAPVPVLDASAPADQATPGVAVTGPQIHCEVCGKTFTEADKYLPTLCGMPEDRVKDGDTCAVDDVPPRINAADGRATVEEVAEAEAADQQRIADEVRAEKDAEAKRIRELWLLPSDAGVHSGLVQVIVKGDGETSLIQIAGVEVPRGFAVMVPIYVADALKDVGELA